jgi:hypothetical protein
VGRVHGVDRRCRRTGRSRERAVASEGLFPADMPMIARTNQIYDDYLAELLESKSEDPHPGVGRSSPAALDQHVERRSEAVADLRI